MRRHLLWAVPLTLTVVSGALNAAVLPDDDQTTSVGTARTVVGVITGLVFLVSLAATLVLGIVAMVEAHRADRARAAATAAAHQASARDAARQGWDGAAYLLRHLAAGQFPAPVTIWGLVLRPGEEAHLVLPAVYSRHYGGDSSYTHVNGFFMGSLPFVAAGYALTAMGNTARRNAALAEAAQRWRDHETVQVVVTNQRLVCQTWSSWLTFDYAGVRAFYPEPENWFLVIDFPDTPPLRLSGPNSPAIAAYVTWALHGVGGLRSHPALAPLRAAAGLPI
ncbi:hypothetical protein [Parafrankia elaeagni]|uniref:hypothetical protein n=1 Tax=Parafrankia elaeagni TaxID=222534 RepID=UPI0003680C9D|nr:hypothetical protein [Parafrankia elaeagni]